MKMTSIYIRLAGVGCGALIIAYCGGCMAPDFAIEDPFFDEWQTIKQESRAAMAEADAQDSVQEDFREDEASLALALSPEDEADRKLPTTLIQDLSLTEKTPVAAVLATLARAGDQNILIGEGVTQSIEISFKNVPWNEAFKSILATAGLSYEWSGDIIRVMSLADMQAKLEIDKVKQESQALQAAARQIEPMHVRMIRIKFSNAIKLGEIVNKILESQGVAGVTRGSVTVDADSNTIIVHASNRDIDKIARLVERLDQAKPQVLIESKIVETNRNTARELGIQWGGVAARTGDGSLHGLNGSSLEGFALNTPATFTDSIGMSLGYTVQRLASGDYLEVQLTALQEDGKINILSSPSITTLDNETAIIEAGEERAYRETSGTGNDLDVSIEWKTATLKLEVTPHVVDSGLLKLDVIVNKDSFDETKPTSSGEFPVNTKKARTTLLLRNGETTVIGGLSQESTSGSVRGVPFLKDVPILGRLFRSHGSGTEFDEIMIFITPHVLLEKAQRASRTDSEEGKSSATTE